MANVVADALSYKTHSKKAILLTSKEKLVNKFKRMNLEVVSPPETVEEIISILIVMPNLRNRILKMQGEDKALEKIRLEVRINDAGEYREETNNAITIEGKLCIPHNEELRNEILSKARDTPYIAHHGSTKMYQDLKNKFR